MATITTPKRYQPTVLYPTELSTFIQYILDHHTPPTNLIICSSQDMFLAQLQASISHSKDIEPSRKHDLLIPTIHQLANSRTINVTFCATLAQLQAYLGVYGMNKSAVSPAEPRKGVFNSGPPTLALLNPLQLHKETSSFSAQGLSRTFASAIEAASRSNQKLLIMECPSRVTPDANPWDQEIAILNVTTKSFGAGERGWVGRTVKVKDVVGRWCTFERLDV
ncbi:hypothetical protein EJ08DRAFT_592359 [Tothia fuscella]|uniref:Uncharacterized protein n=1 Tax=Tothia fuscella TaxID=1048955 RepID=A0A9P4TX52_9PEZI|nr:hypothetical protein EJ08DRAFT_592359 [Tothia fuscella]